jgi:hypothetical protein
MTKKKATTDTKLMPHFAEVMKQIEIVFRRNASDPDKLDRLDEVLDRWTDKAIDADIDGLLQSQSRPQLIAMGMTEEEADRWIERVRAGAKKDSK